jgi:hypothetical protein
MRTAAASGGFGGGGVIPPGGGGTGPIGGRPPGGGGPPPITHVALARSAVTPTADQALWANIRAATNAVSFNNYATFVDTVLCDSSNLAAFVTSALRNLPFPGVDGYAALKAATEIFLMKNCGVAGNFSYNLAEEGARMNRTLAAGDIEREFDSYTEGDMLPYLAAIRAKLGDVPLGTDPKHIGVKCYSLLRQRLENPCMIELLWSYWHEEGMLVQSMNAIGLRFQNRRTGTGERDPLANVMLDPLRPLNNLLWGFLQDEQHRLSVARRAYEYDHHYGFSVEGKAVPKLRSVDSRSKFLEGFHTLLRLCSGFYRQDDDTTVIADGFPLLNALKEVHLLLTQGGHNQYGDLPWNARQEMLMMQWLLARPEMREFLLGRTMVAYAEPWMDRVDAMKTLMGWTDTTVTHFRDLGVFGEQILLSIRFGNWNQVFDRDQAANWARYWRQEIQGYQHAYRAATGVDLREASLDGHLDVTAPSVHLRNRRGAQARAR